VALCPAASERGGQAAVDVLSFDARRSWGVRSVVPASPIRREAAAAWCQPPLRRVSTRPATSVAPAARRTRAISLREKPSE
jgi:hypothetical protein